MMKRIMVKRITAIVLSFVLIATSIAFTPRETVKASKTGGRCGENVSWEFDSDARTITISGTGKMDPIPWREGELYPDDAPWHGYYSGADTLVIEDGVTNVGAHTFFQGNFTNIILGKDVEEIELHAFVGNPLTSITLPEGLETIGDNAFVGCYNLDNVFIPKSVTSIGDNPYRGCTSLTSFEVDEDNSVYHSDGNAIIETESNTLVSGCASTVIPNYITTLDGHAFSEMNISSIELPESLKSIKPYCFSDNDNLTSVYIPENVEEISGSSFRNCSNLSFVYLPDEITSIKDYAFYGCSNDLYFSVLANSYAQEYCEENNFRYEVRLYGKCGDNAFWNISDDRKTLTISGSGDMWDYNHIQDIYPSYWGYVENVENVIIGQGIEYLGDDAFRGFGDLEIVSISDTVSSIGYGTFGGCNQLTDFNIDENNPVFVNRDNCHAIVEESTNTLVCGCKNTVILDSIDVIRRRAFDSIRTLTSVTIPEGVETIEGDAFIGSDGFSTVNIPASVSYMEYPFNRCDGLTTITVDENNEHYDSRNNCNAIIDTDTNTLIQGCKGTVFPDDIVRIEGKAFEGMTGISNVRIPDSVESIGVGAFWCSNDLSSVYLPDDINDISDDAFDDCAENITFSVLEKSYAENWCKNKGFNYTTRPRQNIGGECGDNLHWEIDFDTETLRIYGSGDMWNFSLEWEDNPTPWSEYKEFFKHVVIEEGATSLGKCAFDNCSEIENVAIPASMINIPVWIDDGSPAWCFRNNKSLTEITVASGNPKYDSRNNCNAIIEKDTDILIYGCNGTVIPNSVVEIGFNAFHSSGITSVEFPASVKKISSCAFRDADLESVYIPKTVEYIERGAFDSLNNCLTMEVENGNPNYDSRNGCNAIVLTPLNEIIGACNYTTIDNSIKIIGRSSFWGLRGRSSIIVPANVEIVREQAFGDPGDGNDSLEDITFLNDKISFEYTNDGYKDILQALPQNTTIHAYSNTTAEEYAEQFGNDFVSLGETGKMVYSGNIGWGPLGDEVLFKLDTEAKNLNLFGIGETWGFDKENSAWQDREELVESITVSEGIYGLDHYLFYNLYNAESVSLPNSLEFIRDRVFSHCGITSVNIPKNVNDIGFGSFEYCKNLTTITVDADNEKYDSRDNCNAVVEQGMDEEGHEWANIIAGCKNTTFPESVNGIVGGAFAGVPSLFESTDVTIPNSIGWIGDHAFYESGFTSVVIPECFGDIWDEAFAGSEDLEFVYLPDEINHIDDNVFDNCSEGLYFSVLNNSYGQDYCERNGLRYVTRSRGTEEGECGDNLHWVLDYDTNALTISGTGDMWNFDEWGSENQAPWMEYADDINHVVIEEGATSIGTCAFDNIFTVESVKIPSTVVNIPTEGENKPGWCFRGNRNLTSIEIDENNPKYDSRNDCNAVIEKDTNILIYGCNGTVIPDDVVEVAGQSFNSSGITSIDFPASVKRIGDMAFQNSDLESVYIPKTVEFIDVGAFNGLNNCQTMEVEEGNPYYDSRNDSQTIVLTALDEIIAGCNYSEIDESIKILGQSSFGGLWGRNELIIPANVEIIRNEALTHSSYEDITFLNDKISITSERPEDDRLQFVMNDNVVIHAYSGTSAEEYANQFGNEFVSLGETGKMVYSGEVGWGPFGNEVLYKLDPETKNLNVFGIGGTWGTDPFESSIWPGKEQYVESITVGEGIEEIGNATFCKLDKATSISLPESLRVIRGFAFMDTGLTSVYIPKNVEEINEGIFANCKGLESITVDTENETYDSRNNCNAVVEHGIDEEGREWADIIAGCKETVFDESIHKIRNRSFWGVPSLNGSKEVTIPSTIDHIGAEAFFESELEKVTLEEGVNGIEPYAFGNSEDLELMVVYNRNIGLPWGEYFEEVMPESTTIMGHANSRMKEYADVTGNPFIPFTHSGQCGDNLYWELDGTLTIYGTGDMWNFDECGSENQAPWMEYADDINHVVIEEGATSIGTCAFDNIFTVESVKIPSTVVNIPTEGEDKPGWCFRGNRNLTSIEIDENNPKYDSRNGCNAVIETDTNILIYGCNGTVIPEDVVEIAHQSFNNSGITSIEFPASVKRIGDMAFQGSDLESVYIPKTVECIDVGAFSGLNNCQSMEVEEGNPYYDSRNDSQTIVLTALDEIIAACNCSTIDESIKILGQSSFRDLWGRTELIIPANVEIIRREALAYSSYEDITFLNDKISITSERLEDDRLHYVMNDNVVIHAYSGTSAEEYANQFGNEFVSLGETGKMVYSGEVGWGPFGHEVLYKLDPETKNLNVFGIGEIWGADDFISSQWPGKEQYIESITVGEGIEQMNFLAFANLYKATSVSLPESLKRIYGCAFLGNALTSVYIPKNVEYVGGGAFSNCKDLESITVDTENETYDSRNNCNAIVEHGIDEEGREWANIIAGCKETVFDESIHGIGYRAFDGVPSLNGSKEVIIPSTIDYIDAEAFFGSEFKKVTLEEGVGYIGPYAFGNSEDLELVVVYNRNIGLPWDEDYFEEVMPESTTIMGYKNSIMNAYADKTGNPFIPFVENYTIKINGVQVAEVEEGSTYTFPSEGEHYFEYGYIDNENNNCVYEPGSEVVVNHDMEFTGIDTISNNTIKGASIHMDIKTPGISFGTVASVNGDSPIISNGFTYGTLLTTYDDYAEKLEKSLTLDDLENEDATVYHFVFNKLDKWVSVTEGTTRAGIINLSNNNLTREFVVNSYVEIHYMNGNNRVVYSEGDIPVRSAKSVAQRIKDNSEYYSKLTEGEKAAVNKMAVAE